MKAFPSSNEVKCGDIATGGHAGMDLRDYFAAKCMQGLVVDVEKPIFSYIAYVSYEMADAMMEARNAR